MPLNRYSGVFEPADLALLQRVFDRLCSERGLIQGDNEKREALAWVLISAFQNGASNEDELIRIVTSQD
ncbi:hypothetical protein [Mesorhizobium sp.]|uniref:hypothetical protein n=1 Tax=Mesorhizobium sp. TaxID=1871066 RepID=UPI0025C3B3D4|nr:hypothetical protein [Mesorhizobium sp.]